MTEKRQGAEGETLPGVDPATLKKVRRYVMLGLAVLLLLGVVVVYRYVTQERDVARWEELARIDRIFGEPSTRAWTEPLRSPADVVARDEHIRKLEEFLTKVEADPSLAALVHLRIGNLQIEQIHGLLAAQASTDLAPRFASARGHFETIRDKYPDAPVNQERFRTPAAASLTRLVLDRLAKLEAWEGKHGLKSLEPEPDPVVVLRTSEGDLHVRFFAQASPLATAAFIARVCAGGLDDTLLFEKRDDATEAWVRGGDPRTKGALEAKDPDRVAWGTSSAQDPRAPEEGRNRIVHAKGTISLWHEAGEVADDPLQFLLVLKPSSRLDYAYTPFARVEGEASLATLERIAARKTRAQETPELRTDAKLSSLAEHLLQPVVIRKALVFEGGALKACHDTSHVGEDEKKLADLKPDAYRQ